MQKSTKEIAADISAAIKSFEKDYMGRGPQEIKTFIIEDLIIIRLRGILTPAERNLSSDTQGNQLIKHARMKLLDNARDMLNNIIYEITGHKVRSLHTDIDVDQDERIIVFTSETKIQTDFVKEI